MPEVRAGSPEGPFLAIEKNFVFGKSKKWAKKRYKLQIFG